MAKVALLIGVSEYELGLNPLPAATKDVEALWRVLKDPELGGFDEVKSLISPKLEAMQDEIETLFTGRAKDDLVLLYFSGHGIKDDRGNLYFATRVTRKDRVRSSAVSTRLIHDIMHNCRARRQAIILDCCFSGAFDPALQAKDDGSVDLQGQLGAEGRVVLASSSSTQYSFEQSGTELSLYTRYLVEGIETGAGDLNEDGLVSALELHHYAASRVKETAPSVTPKLISLKDLGFEIVISRAKVTDPRLRYRKAAARYADAGKIRPAGRAVLDTLRQQLGLAKAKTAEIEAEVLRPYQERLANLQQYRDALLAEAEDEYPLGKAAQDALKMLQQLLGLRDEDIAPTEQAVEAQFVQKSEQVVANQAQLAFALQPERKSLLPKNMANPSTAEEFFERGWQRYTAKEQDKESANADFNEVIRLQPNSAYAFCIQGIKKIELEDAEGALINFNEAIRLQPNFGEAYYMRAATKREDDYEGAMADITEAIRLKPDNAILPLFFFARGELKHHLRDKQGAIADYTEGLRLMPDAIGIYYERGHLRSGLGDKQGAIADFTEIIRLKPDDVDAYCQRGDWRSEIGDKQGAIADYSEAIRLEPDPAYYYRERGNLKSELGDKQGAIADLTEAIRLEPGSRLYYCDRGDLKSELGDKQGAIADFTEVIRLEPDSAYYYRKRGDLKFELGDKQGAVADFTEAIRLNPDSADAYWKRGLAKEKLSDHHGAISDYTEVIRLNSYLANAYCRRGVARSELGDKQGAIADFTEAIRFEPDFASTVYWMRGHLKSELGNNQGAMSDYTEAIRLKPDDNTRAYWMRGNVKSKLGDRQGAIDDYTEAIRLEPDLAMAYYYRGEKKAELGDRRGAIIDYQDAARFFQQQGDMEMYRHALSNIAELEKGFLGRLFS